MCDIDGFKALKEHDGRKLKEAGYEGPTDTEESDPENPRDFPQPPLSDDGLGDAWGDGIVRAQAKRL